jgi:hypothetical protein
MSMEEFWSKRNKEWVLHGYGSYSIEKVSESLLLNSIVSNHIGHKKYFIDIGSGLFENKNILNHFDHNILTERFLSTSMGIDRFRQIQNVSIVICDVSQLPFKNQIFDLVNENVTLCNTTRHISKKGGHELFRVLSRSGILFRSTNNNLSVPGFLYQKSVNIKRWPELTLENFFTLLFKGIQKKRCVSFFQGNYDKAHIPYVFRNTKFEKYFAWRMIIVYCRLKDLRRIKKIIKLL